MALRAFRLWLALVFTFHDFTTAHAQVPPPVDPTLRQLERPVPELPPPELPAPAPLPELELIPGIRAPEDRRLAGAPKVFVRRFEFTGNTVFSSDELRAQVTAPYENREISSEELQEIRHKLTLYYVNKGYINSGAVIPDQEVRDGVIQLRIIEGRLSRVEVTGTSALDSDYVSDRIALGVEPPLNVNSLQNRMLLLQQDPMIESIQAELGPGVGLGEAVLRTRIVEQNPWILAFSFANNRSPSIGSERGEILFGRRTVFGRSDPLTFRYGITEGLDDYAVSYSFPLNAQGTSIGFRGERNEAAVIEEPFDELDIESETETVGLSLLHPLHRTPYQEFSLGLSIERRRSETFLLGEPFSFSPGVENGKSTVSVLRFSQNWFGRSMTQAVAARSTFSLGIDAFGATISSDAPDGRFLTWLAQFQWAARVRERGDTLVFRADAQLAEDKLLPLEKFPIGGVASVRGYRENQFVRDNGVVLSLEYRIPVFRLRIPWLSRDEEDGRLELASFADAGWSWEKGESSEDISSVGVGFRWAPSRRLFAYLYWGIAFKNIDNPGHDLQDSGIHFLVSYQPF